MLSPYSAKAIALQILFRRGPSLLATSRLRRRYFFNDPPLIPRGHPRLFLFSYLFSFPAFAKLLSSTRPSPPPPLPPRFDLLFERKAKRKLDPRVLPGKDFVRRREGERGFERLIDENEARTGSYEDFIIGLLLELRAARLKITLRLLFEGVVSGCGWSLVGEDFG